MNLSCVVVPIVVSIFVDVPLLDLTGAVLIGATAAEVVAEDLATAEYETPGIGVA